MSPLSRRAILLLTAGLMSLAGGNPARAQDTPPANNARWSDVAEFGYVATAGNSETATLGFKNTLGRKWDKTSFELKSGGVRAQTTTTTRTAVGTGPSSFTVFEDKNTALSAESYFLSGRFDRKISERVFWFAGGGWNRNRFAGLQNRYEAAGGVGNLWVDRDRVKFRTDYALSYTKEDDRSPRPASAGWRQDRHGPGRAGHARHDLHRVAGGQLLVSEFQRGRNLGASRAGAGYPRGPVSCRRARTFSWNDGSSQGCAP